MILLVLSVLLSGFASAQERSTGQCTIPAAGSTLSDTSARSCATPVAIRRLPIEPGQSLGTGGPGTANASLAVAGGSPPSTSMINSGTLPAGTFSIGVNSPSLTIPGETCPGRAVGSTYPCSSEASGGAPYTWTANPGGASLSGAGLTLTGRTDPGTFSGTRALPRTVNLTLQAMDSGVKRKVATIKPSNPPTATATCGFPKYGCARTDWNTEVLNSMTTVPPDAGSPTRGGGLHHCTAGANGDASHPGLQACGNLYGLNTIITEPAYNNAKIVRASDYSDFGRDCGMPQVGPGGNAGTNVFDSTSNYFVVACGGGMSRIKWFNPSTMQIRTSVDPQGYVHTANHEIFTLKTMGVRASHTHPGMFYVFDGTQIVTFTVSSGIASALSAPIGDFVYGVPCWMQDCPDWKQGVYQRGANIEPAQHNASPRHSFQLINKGSCNTGKVYPDFRAAFKNLPVQVVVIQDGTCQWADMGVPIHLGGKVTWRAAVMVDVTDTFFNAGMSDMKGQDAAGACFGVDYDLSKNQYYHLNVCTGNAYNTVCNRGTGYNCKGGTFSQTYVGNVYSDNPFPSGEHRQIVLHSFDLGQSSQWVQLSANNCALIDTSGQLLNCTSPFKIFTPYIWFPGTAPPRMVDTKSLIDSVTPGHTILGYNIYGYARQTMWQMNKYFGKNLMQRNPGNYDIGYFDVSKGTCTPNPCAEPFRPPFINQLAAKISMDQHTSWVTNKGGDNVPVCMQAYNAIWPWQFPWLGEVTCFATDGSNGIVREANTYNSMTEAQSFTSDTDIGSYSSDGAWWAFNSDWFCTLGARDGGRTPLCGLPFQLNHTYQVGEYVGPTWGMFSGGVGRIYKVTTAGTTDSVLPGRAPGETVAATWCNTAGCKFKSGTAVFTYQGMSNAISSIFLVKMQ